MKGAGRVLATCVLLAACSSPAPTSTPPSSSPTGTGAPQPSSSPTETEPPSSQAIIGADLAAGTIDLPTSLELRAWALFGDARLPERYDGSGSSGEDQGLFEQIAANLDTLPADKKEELSRFLLRPTDPTSPFSAQAPAGRGSAVFAAAAVVLAAQEEPTGQTCGTGGQWWYRDITPPGASANEGFRVWACDSRADRVHADFDNVEKAANELWPKMTLPEPQGMGKPVTDTYTAGNGEARGDGNSKVDVYLVDAFATCRQRGENCQELPGDAAGAAQKDWPLHCGVSGFPEAGCSSYMIMGRGRTDDTDFPGVFAHEFFHVLQDAHNGRVPTSWYHEASATWAGWYYEREPYKKKAYKRFANYQAADDSLLRYDYNGSYQYQAWGWPLFEYIEGGDSNVFQAWAEIEEATKPAEVDRAIDLQFPFKDGFREFAVANAQPSVYTLENGTGLDDVRWQTHPELTDFPTDEHHTTGAVKTIAMGRMEVPVKDLAPLTAQYDLFQVLDENIHEISIDLIGTSGKDFSDLDAVGQIGNGGTWKRFRGVDGRLVFCRDKPDQNVLGALEVIVSNHLVARDPTYTDLPDRNLHSKGTYLIQAAEQTSECNASFVVLHGVATGDRDDELQTMHINFNFDVKWNRPTNFRDTLDMTFMSGDFSAQATSHTVCGGTRSDGGAFEVGSDQQALSRDGDDYGVGAVLADQREDYGRILFHFSASYDIPTSDPLCNPPDQVGIEACPLIFTPIDEETLPTEANCDDGTSKWTMTLLQSSAPP